MKFFSYFSQYTTQLNPIQHSTYNSVFLFVFFFSFNFIIDVLLVIWCVAWRRMTNPKCLTINFPNIQRINIFDHIWRMQINVSHERTFFILFFLFTFSCFVIVGKKKVQIFSQSQPMAHCQLGAVRRNFWCEFENNIDMFEFMKNFHWNGWFWLVSWKYLHELRKFGLCSNIWIDCMFVYLIYSYLKRSHSFASSNIPFSHREISNINTFDQHVWHYAVHKLVFLDLFNFSFHFLLWVVA